MKPRLIDANALYRELHNIGGCGAAPGTWEDGWDQAINEAIRLLERAPTLPRAPARKAEARGQSLERPTMQTGGKPIYRQQKQSRKEQI